MNRETIEHLADRAEPNQTVPRRSPLLPYRPFPIEVMPEPVRTYIQTCATSLVCDPAYVAVPLIAALGSLVGNARVIQIKDGWSEPCIFWCAVIGESGTMKTPAFKAAMKAIRDLQRDAMKVHADRKARYEEDLLHYEKELKAWKAKGDGDSPEKPVEPQPARMIVSDTTIEGLAPILRDNWRGVLLSRDELGGWIASFDQYHNARGADASQWLSLHNAETLIIDRKTGPERLIMAEWASVSIVGGIQPGILRRRLGSQHRENGLLARFLVTQPPRRTKRWTDFGIPPAEEAKIGSLCDRLHELQPQRFDDDIEPLALRFTPFAKQRWEQFYNAHAREQDEMTGDLCAAWSKLEAYPARLALLVHCLRWAADDPTLTSEHAVDEDSLEAGITLSQWFGHEARRVYAMLDESETEQDQRRLVELIEREGGVVTVRRWQQKRSHPKSEDAEAELLDLQNLGYGQLGYTNNPGRPSKRFTLHTYTNKTPSDEPESGVLSVSESLAPRDELAVVLRQLRRDGRGDRAIDVRNEWRERLAITTIDGGLIEAQGQAVALESVLTMLNGSTPTINGGAS